MDETRSIPYDTLLSKIDVKQGQWGLYNFYKMQVCHDCPFRKREDFGIGLARLYIRPSYKTKALFTLKPLL